MKQKTTVFASVGELDPALTQSDYTQGFVAGTVALAEEVNTFGNQSDAQLKIVSDELCNAITDNGITIDENDSSQLATVLSTKVSANGTCLTGVVYDSAATAPVMSGTSISFPDMEIAFNKNVFYGSSKSDFEYVSISAQTISAGSSASGVYYVYATNSGTIEVQTGTVLASDGATKCALGSVFAVGGQYQIGSWAYQPWLQQSSIDSRSSPTASTKGGLMRVESSTTLGMGALQINDEGINYGNNAFDPNIKTISDTNPFTYKFLYVGYDPSASALTELDTTHVYNMTAGTWDDISDQSGFIVMVPCVTPTGQTLMIPAMGTKSGTTYSCIYSSVDEAESAVFGMQYELGTVASRAIYLGQSIIVQVGATDLTDENQIEFYGVVPQELAGFTSQGGQTGGGTGGFIPMNEVTLTGQTVTAQNQTSNIVTAQSDVAVLVNMPTPVSGVLNQFEVKFTPLENQVPGISFPSTIKWWDGVELNVEYGYTYSVIFEYNRAASVWVAGTLSLEL